MENNQQNLNVQQVPQPVYVQQLTEKQIAAINRRRFRTDVGGTTAALLIDEVIMTIVTYIGLFAMMLYMFVEGVSAGRGIESILRFSGDLSSYPSVGLMLTIAFTSILGNTIPMIVYAKRRNIKPMRLFKGGKFTVGFVLGASCLAIALNYSWCYLYENLCRWFPVFELSLDLGLDFPKDSVPGMILFVLTVCVIAPIFEEFAFRGVLLKGLSKYGTTFAVVITSLLFGLFHGNIAQTPATFLIGLVLGYVAVKTGSIKCSIIIHAFNNTLSTILSAVEAYFPNVIRILDYCIFGVMIIGAIIFLASKPGRMEGREPAVKLVKYRYLNYFTCACTIVFVLFFVYSVIFSMSTGLSDLAYNGTDGFSVEAFKFIF